jgi:hypothetical protein
MHITDNAVCTSLQTSGPANGSFWPARIFSGRNPVVPFTGIIHSPKRHHSQRSSSTRYQLPDSDLLVVVLEIQTQSKAGAADEERLAAGTPER